ncbi:TPA: hypothetical protein ACW7QF_001903 [Klebsiella aerogenes]|uniref:hypothetical protein n=1 Tax=Klebsiella TaxID=570 RepID=UPI00292A1E45|nr:hypothetical protein [Klebsiella sp. 141203]MDU9363218.1 hypothetical protein [Klebsiella sp. 141203]
MAKPIVDVNKIMLPLFKKYAVNVDLLESDAHRKSEVLKLRPAFNVDFNANNLMKWCKDNGISLSAVTIKNWMDKENTTVSPKPVKTTTVKQWTNALAGSSAEPQKHLITHAEWLFISAAKNLMTEEQLNAAYNQVHETLVADRMKAIEAEAALAMQALTGRKPDAVFFRELKQFICSEDYKHGGWAELKPADRRRLADMREAQPDNEEVQQWCRDLDADTERATKASNPFAPAEEQATDGSASPSEASAALGLLWG